MFQSIVVVVVLCLAHSSVQQESSSDSVTVSLTVTAVNTTALNSIWTLQDPQNNVTSFHLTWFNSSSDSVWFNENETDHYVIANLVAGTHYNVTLCSLTSNNSPVACNTTRHSTHPETPAVITVSNRSTDTIVLKWTTSPYDYCDLTVHNQTSIITSPPPLCYTNQTAVATGLTPGVEYNLTVTVHSGTYTASNSTINRTNPASPTNINVTERTTTTMAFNWTQTGVIDGCNLTYTGASQATTCVFNLHTAKADGLTPGGKYDFKITVWSEQFSNYNSLTGQYTDAEKVTNVTTTTTEHTINVTWFEPVGNYTGFNVSCVGLVSSYNTTASVESTEGQDVYSAICSNVTSGAQYNVTVYTLLNGLQSQPSDTLQTITVPLPPGNVTTSTVSVSSVQVTWSYMYSNDVSQCTHFLVTHNTSNGLQNTTVLKNPTAYTLTGLTADTFYNIDVQAQTNISQQTQISRRATTSAWTLPKPVYNMTYNDIKPWSLNILITPPSEPNNIIQYVLVVTDVNDKGNVIPKIQLNCQNVTLNDVSQVNCLLNNSDSVISVNSTCSQQITYNITNLQPYTVYNISVQAVNPGGCSDVAHTTETTAESYPECISASNITAVPSNYSMQLTWSAPAKPNGIITKYIVHYIDLYNSTHFSQTEMNTTTTTTLKSLHPYTNYNITVIPCTSVGQCQSPQYINSLTAIGYPYPPTITQTVAVNATQISVTWTLPTDRPTAKQTYYTVTATDNVDTSFKFTANSTGTNETQTVNIINLDEYWNYTVSMIAYTGDSVQYSVNSTNKQTVRTLESTPGHVTNINVTSSANKDKCYEAVVSWGKPAQRDCNGIITGYTVYWIKTNESGSENSLNVSVSTFTVTVGVEADNKAYTFKVKAGTQVGLGVETVTHLGSTGTCGPKAVDESGGVSVFQNASTASDPTKQFNAAFDANIFTSNDNGEITTCGIIVAEDTGTLATINESWSCQFNESKTWQQVKNNQVIQEYRATADNWLPPAPTTRSTVTMVTETIGQSNCDNTPVTEYCNGYVPSGRKYRLRAIICTSSGCYVTKYSSLVFITNNPESLAWIAGVVIPCILLIAAAIVIFILWRRNKKLKKNDNYRQNGSQNHSIDRRSTFHSEYKRSVPIKISQFAEEVDDKHRNANLKFADEYEGIKELSTKHTTTAAEMSQNRVKNRYTNILPFDHSRVKLQCCDETNDDPGADYINANYLEDKQGARDYIAAQGPMTGTIDHFWQLVWEQQVSYIVMVTSLVDKGREKCAKYWPDPVGNCLTYGDIQVKLLSERDVDQFYTVRTFDVSFRSVKRRVTQFYCEKIPDYGIPEDIDLFLDFIRRVRQTAGSQLDPPIVVHCSAGVGRTGTFIAIERLLRYMQSSDTLDIVDLILNMRKYRIWMVQTEAQYICIHDCIKRAIERGFNHPETAAVNSAYNPDEPVYENTRPDSSNNCSTYANIAFQPDTLMVSSEDVELLPIPATRKSFLKT